MDLFLPKNLELQKDGSVTPKDFMKDVIPLPNEKFNEYYKRYWKIASNLKDYEVDKQIPLEQQKNLYKVEIEAFPAKLKQEEEDKGSIPKVIIIKWFLDLKTAQKWARNKIKQASVGFYFSKNNPNKRQYKFSYNLIHEEDFITESAINGKII